MIPDAFGPPISSALARAVDDVVSVPRADLLALEESLVDLRRLLDDPVALMARARRLFVRSSR